ncbi:MAG: hypothetical protein ACW99Q_23830 [Candidatus Kariarchaeaceae archaeon]
MRIALLINSMREFAGNLYIITAILFFLDELPPIQVAAIWSVFFITQSLLDYPTGNLGDTLGYKRILIIAYLFQIAAVPFLLFENQVILFSVFMFLFAMGSSQESGALEAWFDNSYQDLAHDDDPERDIYTRYQARASVLFQAMALLGFLAGGLLASLISRKFVFFIFLILLNPIQMHLA